MDADGQPISLDGQLPDVGSPPVVNEDGNPVTVVDHPSMQQDEFVPESENEVDENNEVQQPQIKRIGRMNTFMNLINALIGAGIVSVPSTFKACGIGPSFILMTLSVFLCNFSSVILLGLQKDLSVTGLNDMAYKVFGKIGMNVISILIIIYCFSCTVAYLIIGANQIVSWLKLAGLNMEGLLPWCLVVLIYLIVLPGAMTIPRDMSCLSKMAIPSVLSVAFYCIAIIVKTCQILPKTGIEPTAIGAKIDFELFTAFGVYALTFSLPVVMLPIIAPYNPNLRKRVVVAGYTFLATWIIICVPGLLGYLMYGANTQSDFLTTFDDDDILIVIVRAGMFISVSASYPAIILSITGSLGQIIWGQNVPALFTNKQRLIQIPIVNIVNMLIAMFLQDIKPILGIGGSLGGCIVAYCFPSACRLKTTKDKWTTLVNIGHIVFVAFGLFAAVVCTISSVKDAITAFS